MRTVASQALVGMCFLGAASAAPKSVSTTTASTPLVTPPPLLPRDGDFVITLANLHTAAIMTANGDQQAIVAPQETNIFVIPTGWSGRVAMYEQGYVISDRASLLEASFLADSSGDAVMAIDVSYVDAFTVPIVCKCNGEVALGCNVDFNPTCPQDLKLNDKTCMNPYRDEQGVPSDNIFGACAGMAYTYPTDDQASKMDIPGCSRNLDCCVGTAC
ncbi:hypothetical protein GGR52DRAFT_576374 [Hypoxylon sp. FL1284]|nr:hypothetical protein GGR52DRAFT_576374 [Hypoxylon sp. FL1284]